MTKNRNWGVGLIAVTRRIQRLSKDYFDLCSHLFVFRIGLKSREYIADLIGWELTRKIMILPQWHFLHYNIETEESSIHVLKLEAGGERLQESQTKPKELEAEEKLTRFEKPVAKEEEEKGEKSGQGLQ